MKNKITKKQIILLTASLIIIVVMGVVLYLKNFTNLLSITPAEFLSTKQTVGEKGVYILVGTGQAKCYDNTAEITYPKEDEAFYGQDAQFAHTSPVYTKSSDGLTVKDEVTGLTWQQSHDSGTYYWAETQAVINKMNKQNYGGYSDWRVPSIKELYSIWNVSKGWPYLNTEYFDIKYTNEENLSHAIFWSTNKYSGVMGNISGDTPGAELAFGVNFGTGHIKAYNISAGPKHFVRAVRGNLTYGVNLFQNNSDGTVSDLATGLMWQQTDNGSGMNWEQALKWVQQKNSENYLGHNDWRLPNTKELQSLVDYTRSPGATNPANIGPAIDPLFSCTGITNDGGNADYPYYWTSTSAVASADDAYTNAWYVAFGRAEDGTGEDLHGAGAVRFDAKIQGSGEGEERVLNFIRLVRDIQ
ncbi:MAG: DUF1566 domain-containing protein [Clostridia bacterium]